jgi:hypothetical protein
MIYAEAPLSVEKRRRAFVRKWRDKCEAVAVSLEEAGDQLFTFTRLPVEQWTAETAAMLFWALLASGQIVLRKVDGWTTIAQPLAEPIDLAA